MAQALRRVRVCRRKGARAGSARSAGWCSATRCASLGLSTGPRCSGNNRCSLLVSRAPVASSAVMARSPCMRPAPVPASVVRRRTSMPGCCAWKSNSRGISHFTVKVLKQATSSGPRRVSLTSRTASAMWAKAVVSTGCSTCAAGVRVGRALVPSNRATPRCCSSWRTWRLMAPGVTDNSSAAAVMRPRRAAASNARRALSGGRRWLIYVILEHINSAKSSLFNREIDSKNG